MTWHEEVGSPTAMLACLVMDEGMVVMDFRFTLTETPQRNLEAQPIHPVYMLSALALTCSVPVLEDRHHQPFLAR